MVVWIRAKARRGGGGGGGVRPRERAEENEVGRADSEGVLIAAVCEMATSGEVEGRPHRRRPAAAVQ